MNKKLIITNETPKSFCLFGLGKMDKIDQINNILKTITLYNTKSLWAKRPRLIIAIFSQFVFNLKTNF